MCNCHKTTKSTNTITIVGSVNLVPKLEESVAKIEPLNIPIEVGKISFTQPVDSASACIILDKSLATWVVRSIYQAIWISETDKPPLRTFSNEKIKRTRKIRTLETSNCRYIPTSKCTIAEEGIKPLIGRYLFDQHEIAVTQILSAKCNLHSFANKKQVITLFHKLITR